MHDLQSILDSASLIDGRFRPVEVLGSGATGVVVLAEDTRLENSRLALKILLPHLLSSHDTISRFRNETRITMSLSHPCIVQTYGLGRQNEEFTFLKMEYCEGEPLRKVIEQYPQGMPLQRVHGLALDISSALHFAHSRGVIHRDLKPENVLISVEGRARILDFGLAQSVRFDGQATREGAILGTPYYMSPEQILSEFTDEGVDIYSFGIVLYEMLVGKRPFDGTTFWELAQCHLETEIPLIRRADVPQWMCDLVYSCAAKDRAKRPFDMNQIFDCLMENAPAELAETVYVPASKHPSRISESEGGHRRDVAFSRLSYLGWSLFWLNVVFWFFAAPHVNESARWRYATCALFVENIFGTSIPTMRKVFSVPRDLVYPDGLFGVGKTLTQKRTWRESRSDFDYRSYTRPLLYFGYDPNFFDPVMRTYPLHYAVHNNQARAIWDLLRFGADPRLPDGYGYRAMDYAVRSNYTTTRTFQALLNAGADPGMTPRQALPAIIFLVNQGKDGLLRVFLEHPNVDPNICDQDGVPALFHALRAGRPMALRLLLENGAAPNIVDGRGRGAREFVDELATLSIREKLVRLVEAEARKFDDGPRYCKQYPPLRIPD